jgi:hypothetical protein
MVNLQIWQKCQGYAYALFETCLIIAGFLAMLEWLPIRYFSDGIIRADAINQLLQGKISPTGYSLVGPSFSLPLLIWGNEVHKVSWLWSYKIGVVLLVVFILIAYLLVRKGVRPDLFHIYTLIMAVVAVVWLVARWHYSGDPLWWFHKYNVFLLATACLVTYLLLQKHVDHSLLRKFFLLLVGASMFGNQVTFFGGETFTALLVGFGVLIALIGPAFVGWLAVILGTVNTPASVIGLIPLSCKHVWDTRRLRYLLVAFAAGILIMAEAWLRRGRPLNNGYGDQHFSTPFAIGLISILFSFGKGLIFFMPGLLLPVKQYIFRLKEHTKPQLYMVYLLWMSFVIGLILIYSSWWAWYGGWFWGPRFFLFACIPASFAIAVRLRTPSSSFFANLLTLGTCILSFWVGINGAIYDSGDLGSICIPNNYTLEYLCHYHPRYSVLWRPLLQNTYMNIGLNSRYFVLYTLTIALWLLMPLLWYMAKQIISSLKMIGQVYPKITLWRI